MIKSLTPLCAVCQFISERDKDCLVPIVLRRSIKLISAFETSLTLELPAPFISSECRGKGYVLPPIAYSIIYHKIDHRSMSIINSNNFSETFQDSCVDIYDGCRILHNYVTSDRLDKSSVVDIYGLKPFTSYAFFVKAHSVYGSSQVIIGNKGHS